MSGARQLGEPGVGPAYRMRRIRMQSLASVDSGVGLGILRLVYRQRTHAGGLIVRQSGGSSIGECDRRVACFRRADSGAVGHSR